MILENNSSTVILEPWFIPIDIILVICTAFACLISFIFLLIILIDKRCHTVPMMLLANSCLSEVIFASAMLSEALFTLENDLKQIQYQDSLCIFRGYLGYIVSALQFNSYFVQALYRYMTIVYPNRLFYQSVKFQGCVVCLMWIWSILCPLPYILTNDIKYLEDDQICQMPLRLSFLVIYNAFCVYMIPVLLTTWIYFKLVRYVRKMGENVTTANTIIRAKRELKMTRQIVIFLLVLTSIGFPYATFIFISLFTTPPKYHFRISYIFIDFTLPFLMILLLKFSEPLKASIKRVVNGRDATIIPVITLR